MRKIGRQRYSRKQILIAYVCGISGLGVVLIGILFANHDSENTFLIVITFLISIYLLIRAYIAEEEEE